ncbi:MAG: TetR/AcrR family transcriptional regulator, partial [Alphaproteobacteria bacterium]
PMGSKALGPNSVVRYEMFMSTTLSSPAHGMSKRDANALNRRHRIILSAHELACENGVAGISFRDISARSGVALGSLTYHYKDRIDLFRDVAVFSRDRFLERFTAAVDSGRGEEDLAQDLANLLELLTVTHREQLFADYEFFLYCINNDGFEDIAAEWSERSMQLLRKRANEATADMLNLLVEGMILHSAKFDRLFPAQIARPMFEKVLASG